MKWFRPGLTGLFSVAFTAGFFMGLIPAEAFVGVATGAIVWWYKSRDEDKAKPA